MLTPTWDPARLRHDDQHILAGLHAAIAACTDNLERFRFNDAAKDLYEFIWHQFCDWHIESAKIVFNGTDPDATDQAQQHKAAAVAKKHRPWTEEETKQLIALRQAGVRWDFIAREIKRCNRAIKERYAELAAELSLPAVVSKSGHFTKMTDEQRAEVVRRRDAGESFGEIGRTMGLRNFMARDCYYRHQRLLKDRRNHWVPA
jgi:hypothetical protein